MLWFSEQDRFHRGICKALGQLLAGVAAGHVTPDSAGARCEVPPVDDPDALRGGAAFLKADLPVAPPNGPATGPVRLVVQVDARGRAVPGTAWIWMPDDRMARLSEAFFTARTTRDTFETYTRLYG